MCPYVTLLPRVPVGGGKLVLTVQMSVTVQKCQDAGTERYSSREITPRSRLYSSPFLENVY